MNLKRSKEWFLWANGREFPLFVNIASPIFLCGKSTLSTTKPPSALPQSILLNFFWFRGLHVVQGIEEVNSILGIFIFGLFRKPPLLAFAFHWKDNFEFVFSLNRRIIVCIFTETHFLKRPAPLNATRYVPSLIPLSFNNSKNLNLRTMISGGRFSGFARGDLRV